MTDSSEIILKKKQMLADALSMMEAAQIIDFNGHFSARSGPDSMLINSGASVRSAITAADIVEIDLEGNLIGDGPGGCQVSCRIKVVNQAAFLRVSDSLV